MGLFKDFKDDFSQAVNELVPGGEPLEAADSNDGLVVDTLGEEVDVKSELSKLDGLLEQVKDTKPVIEELTPIREEKEEKTVKEVKEPVHQPAANQFVDPALEELIRKTQTPTVKENKPMSDVVTNPITPVDPAAATDETSIITASTVLTGNLESSGSFDIQGTINGNVVCNGKLNVTGMINGNSNSSEFFADVAKIEGEVVCTGTVKIGAGSVIIGNIAASSAVIAGAVKGDIDVQGPVVVDTSAVIMGNIKSRSVQINNGAVIEGFCSQCYADIDVQGLFDGK